jgi:Ca-activated chloride channel family protein
VGGDYLGARSVDMQFQNVSMYFMLLPLLLLGLLLARSIKKRLVRFDAFIKPTLRRNLQESSLHSFSLRQLCLLLFSAALCVIALARPQWGFEWKERSQRGIDLVVAVDVSSSMLAGDFAPTRLAQARREIFDLIARLRGDRIALVAFAGVAFTESPLTLDYGAFRLFVNSLTPELIPVGGTNIQAALQESIKLLSKESSEPRAKAIVLITDGEEFDGDPTAELAVLQKHNIRLYVLGIGTLDGAPIPTVKGYKKDKSGAVIVSRLNPQLLESLSTAAMGTYVQATATDTDTRTLYDEGITQQLQASSISWGSAKRWNEYFQLPLGFALFLLGLAWRPHFARSLFNNAAVVTILLTLPTPLHASDPESLGASATLALENSDFERAYTMYSEGEKLAPGDSRFLEGKAASLYRQQRFEEAAQTYLLAADAPEQSPAWKAMQWYNAGNGFVQLERYPEAIELYKRALKVLPEDSEIKENLAYAEKLLKKQDSPEAEKDQQEQQQHQSQNQKENDQKRDNAKSQSDSSSSSSSSSSSTSSSSSNSSSSAESNPEDQQHSSSTSTSSSTSGSDSAETSSSSGEDSTQSQKDGSSSSSSSSSTAEPLEEQNEAQDQEQPQESAAAQSSSSSGLSPQDEMQLRVVQEQRAGQIRFRTRKAIEQLKNSEQSLPEKDW